MQSAQTIMTLGAEAAAQAAIRAMHHKNPMALYSLGGCVVGITFFALPPEVKHAVLSLATSAGASAIAREAVKEELSS